MSNLNKKIKFFGQIKPMDNVEIRLVDKNGNLKQLFSENWLGTQILKFFRKLNPTPIGENSQVKSGLLNYLAAYGLRINGLTGSWGDFRLGHNLITDAGRAANASRFNGAGGEAAYGAIGIGTGTTAAANGDTTLQTEVTSAGAGASGVHAIATGSVTNTRVTTTVTNDTAQMVGTVTSSATIAVTEAGLFNLNTNGTMAARQVFSAINVVSGDSIQFTWKVKSA